MGLIIENKHSSIDLSYTGFARLRTKIAYLHSKELGKFYDELVNAIPMFGKEREIFLKDYEKRLSTIDEELNVSHYLLDFCMLMIAKPLCPLNTAEGFGI